MTLSPRRLSTSNSDHTMPPRKKTKRAHSNSPPEDTALQSSANTPGSSDSAEKPDEPEYDLISDPWTDEQETALLKAIIKWKPVGKLQWIGISAWAVVGALD